MSSPGPCLEPPATYLEEDPAHAAQQLWLLLGVVLDDGAVGVHGQHVFLRDTDRARLSQAHTCCGTRGPEDSAGPGLLLPTGKEGAGLSALVTGGRSVLGWPGRLEQRVRHPRGTLQLP